MFARAGALDVHKPQVTACVRDTYRSLGRHLQPARLRGTLWGFELRWGTMAAEL